MKQYIILILILLSGMSCKKYLDDAYRNPNLPVVVEPELILPSAISNMYRGIAFDSRATGTFVQYFARTTSFDSWERHGYIPGNDQGGEIWRTHYFSFGQNVLDMINFGKASGKNDYVGVGYALFAWGWLNLTDHHGDVILKQAFDRGRLQFDYDPQEEVYPYANLLADSALIYLSQAEKSASTLAAGDTYFFGGDIAKWKKFVSGLKARIYHRYFLKSNYAPDSVIKYTNLAMASPADDALVKFNSAPTDATGYNFYAPARNNMGTFRAGAFLVNLLNGNTFTGVIDPRLRFWFKPCTDGLFRGVPQNQGDFTNPNQRPPSFWGVISQYSAPTGGIDTGGRYVYRNAAPFPLMTYSEMQFLKAEAAHKKGDFATALQAYKNGIGGNMDMLSSYFTGYQSFTATDKNNYINNAAISPASPADLTIRQIMLQKYISLYGWGFEETWVDMRRYQYDATNVYTGFTIPAGTGLYPDNNGKLCYRVRPRYNSEYLWNVESLRKIGGLDADYHTKMVWFAKP
jgi:hypothetical protein